MIYEPIWGAIIAWYLFLAGLGGGAFATAVFVRYRHPDCKRLMRVGRLIAPIVVIIGLCLLMFDATAGFHNPLRFVLLLTNFGSVMTWGVVFLAVFVVVALIVLVLDLMKREVPMWLDCVGLVMGLCVAIYTGCLLGVCQGFPLWNSALLPILFLVSAVSTGMAAVLLVGVFYAPDEFNEVVVMKKFHFWLPVIEFVLVAALLFITAFNPSPAGWESVMSLVSGNWAVAFWLLFVIVGLVLPTILECWMLWAGQARVRDLAHGPDDQRAVGCGRARRRLHAASAHRERGGADHDCSALDAVSSCDTHSLQKAALGPPFLWDGSAFLFRGFGEGRFRRGRLRKGAVAEKERSGFRPGRGTFRRATLRGRDRFPLCRRRPLCRRSGSARARSRCRLWRFCPWGSAG